MNTETIEGLCQWIWNGFTAVDCVEEKNWVLNRLEMASVAADQGNFRRAQLWLASAAENVFGFHSQAYQDFSRMYNLD